MSPPCGVDGEKFCLQIGAHHPHPPQQTHATDLTRSPQAAQHNWRQRTGMGITSIFEPQFYQTGYSKGSRHLDPRQNVSSGFKSRFHSNVVQCKRVKKPCYLHIYIHVYRKCLYKWGRWPAYTLGTPRPRDDTGQTGCVPLSLSARCQAPTSQG